MPLWSFGTSTHILFHIPTCLLFDIEESQKANDDVSRSHGARNPSNVDAFAISKLEDFLNTNKAWVNQLVSATPHLEFLKTWRNPFKLETAGDLHPTGMEQLYQIAKRMREGVLRELVDERGYVPHRHRFSSSAVGRTLKSAQVWSTVFFSDDTSKDMLGVNLQIDTTPTADDWALRFFEACESFYLADQTGAHHFEFDLFRETAFEKDGGLYDAFLERLGEHDSGLDKSHILAMYQLCVFESTLDNTETGFCSLFEAKDIDAYDYLKDLSHYWSRAHGNPFGKSLAAPLLKQIIGKYDKMVDLEMEGQTEGNPVIKSAQEGEAVSFMFGHAETIIPLISLMGLYEDSHHWKHDSPKETWMQRMFKTSEISPFSANVGFLLYECDGGDPYIRVQHNEKDVTVPGCSGTICPWAEFKRALAHVQDISNLSARCRL